MESCKTFEEVQGEVHSRSHSHVLFHLTISVSAIYGNQFGKFPSPYQIEG